MIAIPLSGERARRMLQTVVVAIITVAALGFSLPNLLTSKPLARGDLDFYTVANVVLYAGQAAQAAGIKPGDRIDYARMPAGSATAPRKTDCGSRRPENRSRLSWTVRAAHALRASQRKPMIGSSRIGSQRRPGSFHWSRKRRSFSSLFYWRRRSC